MGNELAGECVSRYYMGEDGARIEVRTIDGVLDEVVAPGFHLEQLDNGLWWMDVHGVHVTLTSTRKITPWWEEQTAAPYTLGQGELIRRYEKAGIERVSIPVGDGTYRSETRPLTRSSEEVE